MEMKSDKKLKCSVQTFSVKEDELPAVRFSSVTAKTNNLKAARHPACNNKGFTLLEMLIAMVIMAIIISVGMPSMRRFAENARLVDAAEQIYGHIQQARVEAIGRSAPVVVKFNGTTTWQYGYSTDLACQLTVTSPTTANACVLVIDDGDGNIHGTDPDQDGTPVTDTGDLVLMRFSSADHPGVSIAAPASFQYDSIRGTESALTPRQITLSLTRADTSVIQLRIVVNALGSVEICTPNNSMDAYLAC